MTLENLQLSTSTYEVSSTADSVKSTFLCIYGLSIRMYVSATMTIQESEDSLKKFTELSSKSQLSIISVDEIFDTSMQKMCIHSPNLSHRGCCIENIHQNEQIGRIRSANCVQLSKNEHMEKEQLWEQTSHYQIPSPSSCKTLPDSSTTTYSDERVKEIIKIGRIRTLKSFGFNKLERC